MKNVRPIGLRKYLLVPNHPTIRIYEIGINIALFLITFLICSLTNIIYFTDYSSGIVTVAPKRQFIMEGIINGDKFQTSEADFMFRPPSDTMVIPKYINKTLQQIFYCPAFTCDNTCLNLQQNITLNPLWCSMPGYVDDFSLPSVEDLGLEILIMFAGENTPSKLKSDRFFTGRNTSIHQILSSLPGQYIFLLIG